MKRILSGLLVALTALGSKAETIVLPVAADTTLFELSPLNNMGAHTHVAAGATGSPKEPTGYNVTRGLFRFDLTTNALAGATINSARLTVRVTFAPGAAANSTFALHAMKAGWQEGNKTGNTGAPATANETTWSFRASPATGWTASGGEFESQPSATAAIQGVGAYTFGPSGSLAQDIQRWIANPASNFGWILLSQSEVVPQTARRFGSRETAGNVAATLAIDYTKPGNPTTTPLKLAATSQGTNIVISWTGGSPLFQLQSKGRIENAVWTNVGPASSSTSVVVAASLTPAFFRVQDGQASTVAASAQYDVTFDAVWSSATHPQDYPAGAHWSGLVGATHSSQVSFWNEGQVAANGIKDVAELGSKTQLLREVEEAIAAGTAAARLSGSGIGSGSGRASIIFAVQRDFPLVTLVSMIAPSPDWFVGVSGLSLIENGAWVETKQVPLFLFDAGTDNGASYASPDQVTTPRQPIRKFTGFPALVNDTIKPFGNFTFARKL